MVPIFLFFLALKEELEKMSYETYGSFCVEFLHDKRGKL